MDVCIVGFNLPGRAWCEYDNVHVGVQRRADVVDLVPGDAAEAIWSFSVDVVPADGSFRGPYVQGRRGDRFFYLSWGTVGDDRSFTMFRRAKLMLDAVDPAVATAAAEPGHLLLATLALTGGDGSPRCAALRPPAISWTASPAG